MKKKWKMLFVICLALLGLQIGGMTAEAAITSITEGTYTLRNVGTGKYLNIVGSYDKNNTNVTMWQKDNTKGEDFKIYSQSGSYALNPLCSSTGRVVNVYAVKAKSGNNVCLWNRTNNNTQLWKFDQVSNGYVIRCADNTSLVLNATGSSNGSNVNVVTYKSGNNNQVWVLENPATVPAPSTPSTQPAAAASTLTVSGAKYPTSYTAGKSYNLKGTITSNYTITQVTGEILNSQGKAVYAKTVYPNAKSYNIAGKPVDTTLKFGKLSAGTYYYRLSAKDASGTTKTLINQSFTVTAKAVSQKGITSTSSLEADAKLYTANPANASKLAAIFAGNVGLTDSKKKAVAAPLGSKAVRPGVTRYYKNKGYSGQSCYIYAHSVYYTLFGDAWGGGYGVPSKKSIPHSQILVKNTSGGSATYANFVKWGVRKTAGALIQTIAKVKGGGQHTMIVLKYDENGIYILEGNADGKGLIRIAYFKWSAFASYLQKSNKRKISFICQPVNPF